MLNLLAKIFALPSVSCGIVAAAMEDEYGHLYDTKGNLYMARWALIRTGTKASKWLSRLTFGRYDHVRLHQIMQPDADRERHNHPFNYRTFILLGWYVEEVIENGKPKLRVLGRGNTVATKNSHFHRIDRVSDYGVTTLFFMGKDNGRWGFDVDGAFIESRKFFKLRRIGADGRAV